MATSRNCPRPLPRAAWTAETIPSAARAVFGEGWHTARHVALGWLDLDHVGAEVGQQHRAEGPGERLGQVEDAQVGERSRGHRVPQWLRRLTRTVRSPSKTTVPSCF